MIILKDNISLDNVKNMLDLQLTITSIIDSYEGH